MMDNFWCDLVTLWVEKSFDVIRLIIHEFLKSILISEMASILSIRISTIIGNGLPPSTGGIIRRS